MTEQPEQEFDIVIAGAGLVGLGLAAALRGSRLRVLVIERGARPDIQRSKREAMSVEAFRLMSGTPARVSAINPGSISFLAGVGAWDQVPDEASAFTGLSAWDARGTAEINFEGDPLGYIVPNDLLISRLLATISDAANVSVRFDTALVEVNEDEQGLRILAGENRYQAALLVGADGAESSVRKLSGISSLSWSYRQSALVTTVKTADPHGQVARQCFTAQGALAFLPLDDPHLCSIVWSLDDPEPLMALSDEAFCRSVSQAFEHRLGDVLAVERRISFPLVQRHALGYARGRFALLGDAAHTLHPLAGQGVNLGFADAAAMARLLINARLEGRDLGSRAVLAKFTAARLVPNIAMSAAVQAFRELYGTDNPGIGWLRNEGMRFIEQRPLLKSVIGKLARFDKA